MTHVCGSCRVAIGGHRLGGAPGLGTGKAFAPDLGVLTSTGGGGRLPLMEDGCYPRCSEIR